MNYLQLTLDTPAWNLAADEALLELAETKGVEALRIWESPTPFVALGLSNHLAQEVQTAECERRGVPILRRVSGGGTVLQGPGCLSYALTLQIPETGPLATITGTNQFVMARNRSAMESLLDQAVTVRGHTDLEFGGRKFSGNAQRRGRRALLFHGTILHGADLDLLAATLSHPSREPDWRSHRVHRDFITNLNVSRERIAEALRSAWSADQILAPVPTTAQVESLAIRHRDPQWIHRRP